MVRRALYLHGVSISKWLAEITFRVTTAQSMDNAEDVDSAILVSCGSLTTLTAKFTFTYVLRFSSTPSPISNGYAFWNGK